MPREPLTFEKSRALLERARNTIPRGSQATRLPEFDEYPVFFERAKGCRMWDVDGNEFLDMLASIGPIILGYAYDVVDDAVREVIRTGFQSSMNHPVMIELAEKLVEIVPSAERVRFLKTGSEATHAAVRAARHCTGREKVARCGYHGWFDMWWSAEKPGIHGGSTGAVVEFDGSAGHLEDIIKQGGFAAVIICPAEIKPFSKENLQGIVDVAHRHGAMMIFDEVKTGFRTALGGVQERLGVTPDITTLSKAMANGYPLAAVVGGKEVMDKMAETPTAGTFSVEAVALTASLATIGELQRKNIPAHLEKLGARFIEGLNKIAADAGVEAEARPVPVPCMPQVFFTDSDETRRKKAHEAFFLGVIRRGLFLAGWHQAFIMASHTEADIDEALAICADAMEDARKALG